LAVARSAAWFARVAPGRRFPSNLFRAAVQVHERYPDAEADGRLLSWSSRGWVGAEEKCRFRRSR
jgi:hypothetical protein